MPLGGEAMGSAIGGFFGGPKLKQINYSDTLRDTQRGQASALTDLRGKADAAVAEYSRALEESKPQLKQITQENLSTLGEMTGGLKDLSGKYSGFDPVSTYERIRGGNIASLADQFVNLASAGQRGDKAALAALGYGGRGPGSYESILRTDRISRNIAPVLNTIYGNLGSDTASLNTNRLMGLEGDLRAKQATLEFLKARQQLPAYADSMALLPYQAAARALSDEIGMGGDLAEAVGTNTAGFESKKNKWANFFEQSGRAFDQVADTAIDLYSSYMGGGLGGLGGMGGGKGGAGAAPPPNYSSLPGVNRIQGGGAGYDPYYSMPQTNRYGFSWN